MTIPVVVLSLPDCHDRRARVSAALDGLGLPFEFVDAVDGRRGLPPEYESQIDRPLARKLGRNFSDVEFACALSHINIYRRIVSENIDYALVMEDDAVPQPDLVGYLAGKHYEGASLTQLVCHNRRVAYVRRSGAKSFLDSHRSYLRAPKMKVSGASGYVISRRAAKHFVKNALPVTCAADWPDCIEALIARQECRLIAPSLVRHEDHGVSFISQGGRKRNKERRRFFGIYIPHFRNMMDSYKRTPLKLFCKRLRTSEI